MSTARPHTLFSCCSIKSQKMALQANFTWTRQLHTLWLARTEVPLKNNYVFFWQLAVSRQYPMKSQVFVQSRCLDTSANTIYTLSLWQQFIPLDHSGGPCFSMFPHQKQMFHNVLWSWPGLYGNSESFKLVCSHSLSGFAGNDSPHYLKYPTKH